MPDVTYYKPAGVPMRLLEEICLTLEELEAIRLRDLEDLEQEAAGKLMNVSRATFQRILESARRKIADALLNGKAIKIEGGCFEMSPRRFRCASGHEWEIPFNTLTTAPEVLCPDCRTTEVFPLLPTGHGRWRHGRNDPTRHLGDAVAVPNKSIAGKRLDQEEVKQ